VTPGYAKPRSELPWLPYRTQDKVFVINSHNFPSLGFNPAVNGKMPIAAWIPTRDDAGNGTTTLNDLVGTANGTLTNMDAATDWVADTDAGGVRALDFDGVNDEVILGNLGVSSNAITISAWVKRTDTLSPNAGIVCSRTDGNIGLVESFGATDSVSGTWNNTSSEWGNAGLSLALDQWHLIAMTVSGASLIVYRDLASVTIAITPTTRNLGVFRIGNDSGTGSRFFKGRIDDVRIWSQALNATDVADLYAAQRGGITNPPLAQYFTGIRSHNRRRKVGT